MSDTVGIFDELDSRGLVQDASSAEELRRILADERVCLYAGYDPTAASLHVGSLVPTILLARLQRAGHKPLALVGGATGMIGDPSGRSSERNLLDEETLAANVAGIRSQLGKLLDFDSHDGAELVNNADWFKDISFIQFLRDVGKHLTVSYMIHKESVRARLEDREQGISYTEFSYMLLQAYDFVALGRSHGCTLQVGGSDQWGNITAGIELGRRMDGKKFHGFTAPLLLDSAGQKMGKTSTGTRVWLDPALTSPYAFYQYWLNVADDDVARLLRIFSAKPLGDLADLEATHRTEPHRRAAQKVLAEEMVVWVHGREALIRAQKASAVMFGGSLEDLEDEDLAPLLADLPSSEVPRSDLDAGVALIDLLVDTKLCPSKGEARRLLKGGGVYINNLRNSDVDRTIGGGDLATKSFIVLRAGKKKYHLIKAI